MGTDLFAPAFAVSSTSGSVFSINSTAWVLAMAFICSRGEARELRDQYGPLSAPSLFLEPGTELKEVLTSSLGKGQIALGSQGLLELCTLPPSRVHTRPAVE